MNQVTRLDACYNDEKMNDALLPIHNERIEFGWAQLPIICRRIFTVSFLRI